MEVAFDNIRQAEGITDDILPLKEKLENLIYNYLTICK